MDFRSLNLDAINLNSMPEIIQNCLVKSPFSHHLSVTPKLKPFLRLKIKTLTQKDIHSVISVVQECRSRTIGNTHVFSKQLSTYNKENYNIARSHMLQMGE